MLRFGLSVLPTIVVIFTCGAARAQEATSVDSVRLGVTAYDADSPEARRGGVNAREGVFIAKVFAGHAAATCGLQAGDVVIACDGQRTPTFTSLQQLLRGTGDGQPHELTVVRGDRVIVVTIVPGTAKPTTQPLPTNPHTPPDDTEPYLGTRLRSAGHAEALAVGIESPTGAAVIQVMRDTPAAHAGMRRGDLIVQFGDRAIETYEDLEAAVIRAGAGSRQRVVFVRGQRRLTTEVTLGSQPASTPSNLLSIANGTYRVVVRGKWAAASVLDPKDPNRLLAASISASEGGYELQFYHVWKPVNPPGTNLDDFTRTIRSEHSNSQATRLEIQGVPGVMVAYHTGRDRQRTAYRISFAFGSRQYFIDALAPPLAPTDRLPPVVADILARITWSEPVVTEHPNPPPNDPEPDSPSPAPPATTADPSVAVPVPSPTSGLAKDVSSAPVADSRYFADPVAYEQERTVLEADAVRLQQAFEKKDAALVTQLTHPLTRQEYGAVFQEHEQELARIGALLATRKLVVLTPGENGVCLIIVKPGGL